MYIPGLSGSATAEANMVSTFAGPPSAVHPGPVQLLPRVGRSVLTGYDFRRPSVRRRAAFGASATPETRAGALLVPDSL